jgi:hypothetical protein
MATEAETLERLACNRIRRLRAMATARLRHQRPLCIHRMVFTWWAGAYGGGAQRDGNHDRKFAHRFACKVQ